MKASDRPMQAYNRPLYEWFNLIDLGQLTLPRFQRDEAWTHSEVSNLLRSMLKGLPTGAALILKVDGEEQFPSRNLAGTQSPSQGRYVTVTEQLLDGQQRITAMWKSLHDLYDKRTFFVSFVIEAINTSASVSQYLDNNEIEVVSQSTYEKNGNRYPIWIKEPRACWDRGLVPVSLFRPYDIARKKRDWLKKAVPENEDIREFLDDLIDKLRDRVRHFNLPYLLLPSTTKKDVALDVFVKLNTSSVKLTAYDIVVALVEDASGESLHELVDSLSEKVPKVMDYAELPELVLDTVALLQDLPPNKAGYTRINYQNLVKDWADLESCFTKLVDLLEEEHIYDEKRLPSYTALPVIAALTKYLPEGADELGNARLLIKKYMWKAFLTDRYEKTTATNSYSDFRKIRDCILGKAEHKDIPIFNEQDYPVPVKEIIADAPWPKTRTILGRGLLALQIKCGAYDIADSTPATKQSIPKREYHHLFPAALLRKADITRNERQSAVNCALISWETNRTISDKNPMQYLLERADNCDLGEAEIERRLRTHLIPIQELKVDYDDLDSPGTKKKIAQDYERFIDARAELLEIAAKLACDGEELNPENVFRLHKE